MTTTRLNVISQTQIQTLGLQALKDKLGVTGTLRFLEQFDNGGSGDYTKEKYETEDIDLTKEEILNMFKL